MKFVVVSTFLVAFLVASQAAKLPHPDGSESTVNGEQMNGNEAVNTGGQAKDDISVYFVNYDGEENPILFGGIDLQTALETAVKVDGKVIEGR